MRGAKQSEREFVNQNVFGSDVGFLPPKRRHQAATLSTMTRRRVLLAFLCISALALPTTHAAHSRRRPVVVRREVEPRYDRSITTFSSDGRLQQVEYGLEASRRGDSVVAVSSNTTTCIAVHSSDKVHRIDAHIIMVTAGLVGDGRMLASTLRSQCHRFRIMTGEEPTLQEVARLAADLQHMLTRNPGGRPLGCTAILAGVEDGIALRLFQTDPGGILEECHFCAAGKGQDKAMSHLESLINDLDKSSKEEGQGDTTDQTQMIRGVAEIALDALQDKEGPSHVDVWKLQGDKTRRGGVHLRCIQKITRQDLTLLKGRLSKLVGSSMDAAGE